MGRWLALLAIVLVLAGVLVLCHPTNPTPRQEKQWHG